MRAQETFDALLSRPFSDVLDIGSGDGTHALAFKDAGKRVTTINLYPPADYVGDYLGLVVRPHSCIWACHVLEHCPNPGLFLSKCFSDLKEGGWLAVTVPPRKDQIVGGHVTVWNAGLLLYNLILAGFDCREASVKSYGYNVSVIVQKRLARLPALKMDFGDIEALAEFFPMPVTHGFDGMVSEANW